METMTKLKALQLDVEDAELHLAVAKKALYDYVRSEEANTYETIAAAIVGTKKNLDALNAADSDYEACYAGIKLSDGTHHRVVFKMFWDYDPDTNKRYWKLYNPSTRHLEYKD